MNSHIQFMQYRYPVINGRREELVICVWITKAVIREIPKNIMRAYRNRMFDDREREAVARRNRQIAAMN